MNSVGRFLAHFRRLDLKGHQIGGDQGFGYQLMDRMAEEGFHLRRVNNHDASSRPDVYCNQIAEWWDCFALMIERREIILPPDEKLIAQLTNRRREYDSKGRLKLESKADLKARGGESPDRADALIGAAMLAHGPGSGRLSQADIDLMREQIMRMERENAKWCRSGLVRF
jgi:hypothetical protein